MPNSLRCKVKNLFHKGILNEKDRDRLIHGLDCADALPGIRAEIADLIDINETMDRGEHIYKDDALDVIDKHLNKSGFEVWNSIHGERIVVPKGTFMQIYNDDEEENDGI